MANRFKDICKGNWDEIAEETDPKEFGERLKSSWELAASLSGFIAGFTYIVSSGVPEYDPDYEYVAGTRIRRVDAFVVLVLIAFIFALLSTLLGFLMIGIINQVGVERAKIFRARHSVLSGFPEQFLVLAVFFMLISAVISIGGNCGTWIFVTCFIVAIMFGIIILYLYFITMGYTEKHTIIAFGTLENVSYKIIDDELKEYIQEETKDKNKEEIDINDVTDKADTDQKKKKVIELYNTAKVAIAWSEDYTNNDPEKCNQKIHELQDLMKQWKIIKDDVSNQALMNEEKEEEDDDDDDGSNAGRTNIKS